MKLHSSWIQGFTLLECLITLLLITLLSALAWPSYAQYVAKTHAIEAETVLWENAQFMHRWYQNHGHYKHDSDRWPALPFSQSPKTGRMMYQIVFSAEKPSHTGEDQFTIRAKNVANVAKNEFIEINEYNNIRHCLDKHCTTGKLG